MSFYIELDLIFFYRAEENINRAEESAWLLQILLAYK